jgi:hypothetical protein
MQDRALSHLAVAVLVAQMQPCRHRKILLTLSRYHITGGTNWRINLRLAIFGRLHAAKWVLSKLVRGFFFQQQPFFFGV